MDWNNLFGTDTFTYGFNSLTQDEFCTAVLVILGIICICLSAIIVHNRHMKTNTEETNKILNECSKTLKDLKTQLHEITLTMYEIQESQPSKDDETL